MQKDIEAEMKVLANLDRLYLYIISYSVHLSCRLWRRVCLTFLIAVKGVVPTASTLAWKNLANESIYFCKIRSIVFLHSRFELKWRHKSTSSRWKKTWQIELFQPFFSDHTLIKVNLNFVNDLCKDFPLLVCPNLMSTWTLIPSGKKMSISVWHLLGIKPLKSVV